MKISVAYSLGRVMLNTNYEEDSRKAIILGRIFELLWKVGESRASVSQPTYENSPNVKNKCKFDSSARLRDSENYITVYMVLQFCSNFGDIDVRLTSYLTHTNYWRLQLYKTHTHTH